MRQIVFACALALLTGLPGTIPARAQSLHYTTSWVGNSFGGELVPGLPYHHHVQINADDVFVAADGTVYTDTGWDENGYETGFIGMAMCAEHWKNSATAGDAAAAEP